MATTGCLMSRSGWTASLLGNETMRVTADQVAIQKAMQRIYDEVAVMIKQKHREMEVLFEQYKAEVPVEARHVFFIDAMSLLDELDNLLVEYGNVAGVQ